MEIPVDLMVIIYAEVNAYIPVVLMVIIYAEVNAYVITGHYQTTKQFHIN